MLDYQAGSQQSECSEHPDLAVVLQAVIWLQLQWLSVLLQCVVCRVKYLCRENMYTNIGMAMVFRTQVNVQLSTKTCAEVIY